MGIRLRIGNAYCTLLCGIKWCRQSGSASIGWAQTSGAHLGVCHARPDQAGIRRRSSCGVAIRIARNNCGDNLGLCAIQIILESISIGQSS
jgi:hypothetical protein